MIKEHFTFFPRIGDSQITIHLEDESNNVVSEVLTYEVESKPCNGRTFFYLTRKGGFDTFHFLSIEETELKTDRSTFLTSSGVGALEITGERSKVLVSRFLTISEAEWLQELFESPFVLAEYVYSGIRTLRKVVITSKKQLTTSADMIRFEIEYQLSQEPLNQTSYSRKKQQPIILDEPTDGEGFNYKLNFQFKDV